MQSYIISQSGMLGMFALLLGRRPVMAPRERSDQPGFYLFDWVSRAEQIAAAYHTTTIPPKKAFFAPVETLFQFKTGAPPAIRPIFDHTPFVLAGVHPCDLAAIEALDEAYSEPPGDARWQANRRRAFIIGMDCMPDDYCFCTSVGTCRARGPCDLFLTPVERGYVVESFSSEGEEILQEMSARRARSNELEQAEKWLRQKEQKVAPKLGVSVSRFADILEAGGLTEVWREVASRCYSCGSCNTTCPTCFCFDINDRFDLTLTKGLRQRSWDSCQLLEFALVAGGHNFRSQRWQRVRHRWQRKFLYLYRKFGRPYCTGCGRCSRACTADINLVDVCNQLVAHRQRRAANA